MDNGEFKSGTQIEKDELLVIAKDQIGYTIDYIGDDGASFEMVVVWEDEKLRNRIVELLNRYGEEDAAANP
jgi:hypothetical protein